MSDINRQFPSEKIAFVKPSRFKSSDFNICSQIVNNDRFKKLESGINYKTGRKIKIHGKTYKEIRNELCRTNSRIIELKTINRENYLFETKRIYEEIDRKNEEVKNYNIVVRGVIEEIKRLENWNDYVIFNGQKYGISDIHNNIHRTNDCFGEINTTTECEQCRCHACENWWHGCGDRWIHRDIKQCKKCNQIIQ